MSIDSLYNSNPSLKLKILQDVVEEYAGYLSGARIENNFGIFGDPAIQNALDEIARMGGALDSLNKDNDEIKRVQKAIISKFLFSSNGCYQIKDLLGNELVFDNLPKNVSLDNSIAAKHKISDALVVLFEDELQSAHMSSIFLKEFDALYSGDYLTAENAKLYTSSQNEEGKTYAEEHGLQELSDVQNSVINNSKEKKASMRKMMASLKFTDNILDKRDFEGLDSVKQAAIFDKYKAAKALEDSITEARKSLLSSNKSTNEKKEEPTLEYFKNNVLPIYTADQSVTGVSQGFINNKEEGAINDPKPTSPAMSAIVIKDQSMGYNTRNDNFLSVFLGAVTPLELSRCVPYLTLTFFNEAIDSSPGGYRDYLDNIAYMKFAGGKDGVFSKGASDPNGLGSVTPEYSKTETNANRAGPVGYMDIFTAPQTMVNANINKGDLGGIGNKSLTNQQINNVLDPLAPMLSLGNLSITVPGGQYFLVTNRRVNLSVTLHDRSRLEDISPFVSLNQLQRTIVRIEHGWSHPEGDIIKSKNSIGKFLNSMRESGYYTLTSSSFSFNGNSVKIDMVLDFFAATDFVDNNICFGEKKPIQSSSLQRSLSRMFDDILERQDFQIPQLSKEATAEEKKENRKKASNIKNVIKSIQILRTHSQNSTLAVDTTKAQKLEDFINKADLTGNDKKFIPTDTILSDFLVKFFDLLGLKEAYNLSDDTTLNQLKEIFSEKGFSKEVSEKLRLNYAKETIEKVNSLIGNNYKVDIKSQDKAIKASLAPDPVDATKQLKKESKPTQEVVTNIEKIDYNLDNTQLFDEEVRNYYTKLTPDYFLTPRCFKTNFNTKKFNTGKFRDWSKDYTSLGKLICAFVGLPSIAGNSNYTELQVFFYPINNQAAGARKYTTASLPVSNVELLKHVEKAIKNDYNLTLKNFFEMLSNMFENNELDVYELGEASREKNIDQKVREELKKDKDQNHEKAYKILGRKPNTDKERKIAYEAYKKQLYETFGEAQNKSLNDDLKRIYSEDGLGPAPLDKFTKPILQMEIEAIPIIALPNLKTTAADSLFDVAAKGVQSFFGVNQENDAKITGKDDSKRILRIHIYDANASSKPFEKIAMESAVEFDKFIPFGGAQEIKFNQEINPISLGDELSTRLEKGELSDKLKTLQDEAKAYFQSLTPKELKQYLIRSFPTIRYGSHTAVVKQISVKSNTTDKVIEARTQNEIKKAYDKKKANIQKGNDLQEDFSAFVIPTSVDITLYGCPFITVGTQLFLDLGTGTDIDNIYMVTELNHQIGRGEYTTSITVSMPAQGTVKSSKDKLADMITLLPDPTS